MSPANSIRLVAALALVATAACGEVVGAGGGVVDAGTAPSIQGISPDHGPIIGGATVTITGTGFTAGEAGDAQVMVGEFLATDVTVVDDGTVTFTLPAGLQEGSVVDVVLFNQNGIATAADSFRYNERPIIISVDPAFGKQSGGTTITITGRGFESLEAGAATVTVGGVAATGVTVVDDQTITAVLAENNSAEPFTPVDLEVGNLNGSDVLEGEMQLTGQGLIVIDRNSRVHYVRPSTGQVKELSRASRRIHACSRVASGNLVVQAMKADFTAQELAAFDPLTGVTTPLGNTNDATGNRSIHNFAFVAGQLYGLTGRLNRSSIVQSFASVNPTNGTTLLIGPTQSFSRPPTVAVRDTTSVWAIDSTASPLRIINLADGAVSTGPSLSGITPAVTTHGLVNVGGTLYAVERFGLARIFSINTTTGAMATVGQVSQAQLIAVCETPTSF